LVPRNFYPLLTDTSSHKGPPLDAILSQISPVHTFHSYDIQAGFPAGHFSLLHSVQTDSGAHAASYPMGTGISFSGE
jgi:hypothetical protein